MVAASATRAEEKKNQNRFGTKLVSLKTIGAPRGPKVNLPGGSPSADISFPNAKTPEKQTHDKKKSRHLKMPNHAPARVSSVVVVVVVVVGCEDEEKKKGKPAPKNPL